MIQYNQGHHFSQVLFLLYDKHNYTYIQLCLSDSKQNIWLIRILNRKISPNVTLFFCTSEVGKQTDTKVITDQFTAYILIPRKWILNRKNYYFAYCSTSCETSHFGLRKKKSGFLETKYPKCLLSCHAD